ncbi:hypothetical protein BJV74DRAFT_850989 [Russula compacta]|nr:hypothetical protein BJV74DRAFT_850989 [Russula compacta]
MATVTHYIRSEYDAEVDKDRLLRETGQVTDNDDHDDHDHVDLWQTESASAGFHLSRRRANAPKFVPALLPYDEWGSAATPACNGPTSTASVHDSTHVATWYRSLSRQGAGPAHQQSQRNSEASLEPPSPSSSPPSSTQASSASLALATGALSSSARLELPNQHRSGRDWFISRAIAQSQSSSAPQTPRPNTASNSLADILERHPPSAQPLRPPVFLHLGPSNKGWTMLQNQGWSEGEGLGSHASSNDAHTSQTLETKKEKKMRKRARLDSSSPSREQVTEVVLVPDDDDPIVEVRKKTSEPIMIDLTQSDVDVDEEEDDGEVSDDDDSADDDGADSPAAASDPRAAQTALLTPLPTVLKSDRLGIGLKAKTEGPYRSSVKRVTPSAAALAAHLKAAEDMRRAQRRHGKGRRAFARVERLERESRQNLMAYLSEP